MLDKGFANWWVNRVSAFVDVAPEKLAAEREALARQQDYNSNYEEFLKGAVFPAVEEVVKLLSRARVVHRVSTWGNQLSLRIHLSWRWGELVISQSHDDCVTFGHHIFTEGERRGEDSSENHEHQYDCREPLPAVIAATEIQFFLSRLAQDMVEPQVEDDMLPGEGLPKE
jgi:hypothetical protein